MRPPLWTWVRLDENGTARQRSAGTFLSYEEALRDAIQNGFDPKRDPFERIDEQSRAADG